jgi:hypothetical protein
MKIQPVSPVLDFDMNTAWWLCSGKKLKIKELPHKTLSFPTFHSILIAAMIEDGKPELMKEN